MPRQDRSEFTPGVISGEPEPGLLPRGYERGGILRCRFTYHQAGPVGHRWRLAGSLCVEGVDDVGVLGVHDAALELERGG
jgi:hypothetical protein